MTQAGPTIADVVFPEQLNHRGTLFGGAAMALMDRAAFVAASREARGDVVCAGADDIAFSQPIRPGDLVEATAVVQRRGRRSMTVEVVVIAETLQTGERREAVRGLFHMVAAEPLADTEAPQSLPKGSS